MQYISIHLDIPFHVVQSRTALRPTTTHLIPFVEQTELNGHRGLFKKKPHPTEDNSLHVVSMSRMRGALLPRPQYAYLVWCLVTGIALPSTRYSTF
jgi:hypothetical protein